MTDRLGLVLDDGDLPVLGLIAQWDHTADPKALPFRGPDLVANALGGDLPLELGERQQTLRVSRPIEVVVLNC